MLARLFLLFGFCLGFLPHIQAETDAEKAAQKHYWRVVRPILHGNCGSCHNAVDTRAGINLVRFDFIVNIVRNGKLFTEVIRAVEEGSMPPNSQPALRQGEKDTLLTYLRKYLDDALAVPDPGIIPPRRLSNREYGYAIEDLFGVQVNTDSLLPADASGGSGFDNQASTGYMSALRLEKYFEATEWIVNRLYSDSEAWPELFPPFQPSFNQQFQIWWGNIWGGNGQEKSLLAARNHAEKVLTPIASLAYRRLLRAEEKIRFLDFFEEVYQAEEANADRMDRSLQEVLKSILLSPNFLYRQEADLPSQTTYPLNNFELASRLSFLIWSSIPDQELLQVAYQQDLHDPDVLNRQMQRLLDDPRSRRLAENFATQWLEINRIKEPSFSMDEDVFPEYNATIGALLHQETVAYFHHVFTQSQNLLELLDSDYTFLNQRLAQHYGLNGTFGDQLALSCVDQPERGGLLGMGAVLATTSMPHRTSPVLRGKWVLEQILGTPPPPPPADVPELEASQGMHDELSLRQMLELHRADPACSGCHRDMDALGLGMESFDALGRWRETYQNGQAIDASGELRSGELFVGPVELKQILNQKQELFARNFSEKMLSFALGRSLSFYDTPTVDLLSQNLLDNDFDSREFLFALVNSFPFRYKKTDHIES